MDGKMTLQKLINYAQEVKDEVRKPTSKSELSELEERCCWICKSIVQSLRANEGKPIRVAKTKNKTIMLYNSFATDKEFTDAIDIELKDIKAIIDDIPALVANFLKSDVLEVQFS